MSLWTFPRLTAAGLGASVAAGVAHQVYSTWRSTGGHAGYERRRVRCRSGNLVDYHVRRGLPGGPTLVCESGLMSTSAAWLLLADHLDPSVSVVLYDRAGYRGSLRRCNEDYSLRESVDDLVDVVVDSAGSLGGAAGEPGPCVLTGHSLGGYLVHRAAAVLPGRVHGLVLIDPTHPRELLHSRKQREGSRATNLSIRLGPETVLLGGGLLIDKKNLFAFAEESPYHRTLRLEGSSITTWRSSRREWRYAYAFMLDGGRPLDRLDVPVSVVAAQATMDNTPEHGDLYEEYVDSGAGGEVSVVPGSSHLAITGSTALAPQTAKLVQAFVDEVVRGRSGAQDTGGAQDTDDAQDTGDAQDTDERTEAAA
ncbi:alpha/beta hydrolase [Streptomyces sp. NPDC047130]|uniref:alpha/beta hydrolase n=1 Tax=Streptomyces sp. NPDC047130 TaxID=3155261 RepID=UPI003403FE1A